MLRSPLRLVSSLGFLAAALAPPAASQTGPWTDGEILVLGNKAGFNVPALYRVVPETGASALLLTDFVTIPQSIDGTAFDSHRGGLLMSGVLLPDPCGPRPRATRPLLRSTPRSHITPGKFR